MIPRISGMMRLSGFLILMTMKAIRLVETIWIKVLTNPLPISRLIIFTFSLFTILFIIYNIFSTALNHNQIKIQKKIRLLGFCSLFARNILLLVEYFIYSSAYAEIK